MTFNNVWLLYVGIVSKKQDFVVDTLKIVLELFLLIQHDVHELIRTNVAK